MNGSFRTSVFSVGASALFFHSTCWSVNHSVDPHSQTVQDQRFCWPGFEVDIQGGIKRGEYPHEVLPWGFSPTVLLLSPSETSWVTISCCASSVHLSSVDLSPCDTMQTCALKITHSFSAVPNAPVQPYPTKKTKQKKFKKTKPKPKPNQTNKQTTTKKIPTKTKLSPQTNSSQKATTQNPKPQTHNSWHRQSKTRCFLIEIYKSLDCCNPGGILMGKEIFRAGGVLNQHLGNFQGLST